MTVLSTTKKNKTKRPRSDDNGGQTQPKRTKSPGLRVQHGRIYDSENGKTCHQCRQKTLDLSASCKNQSGKKPCTVHICHKCLLNRYGEIAEEVVMVNDWSCPKCRGICNCSFCMKKKGHKPTGTLIRAAKATGLSSASELIQLKGVENLDIYKTVVLPKKLASPKFIPLNKESKFVSSSKMTLDLMDLSPISITKKRKRVKREEGFEYFYGAEISESKYEQETKRKGQARSVVHSRKKKSKNFILDDVSMSPIDNEEKNNDGYGQVVVVNNAFDDDDDVEVESNALVEHRGIKKYRTDLNQEEIEFDLSLPKVNMLRTALGIDLSAEDIGHALQFLEFCASFGKACKTPIDQTSSKEKMDGVATPCSETSIIPCLRSPSPTH